MNLTLLPLPVTLDKADCLQAISVGGERRLAALLLGLQDHPNYNPKNEKWAGEIEGAGGERAFARAAGRHWQATVCWTREEFDRVHEEGDVGMVEVRWRKEHWYDLVIRDSDDLARAYVLVTGSMPHYVIQGWIWGMDVTLYPEMRQSKFDQPEAWWIDQSVLIRDRWPDA